MMTNAQRGGLFEALSFELTSDIHEQKRSNY